MRLGNVAQKRDLALRVAAGALTRLPANLFAYDFWGLEKRNDYIFIELFYKLYTILE